VASTNALSRDKEIACAVLQRSRYGLDAKVPVLFNEALNPRAVITV
jgi:hypothetical protein